MTTDTEHDDGTVFERAGALFTQRVHEVPDDAWDSPTPCPKWDVRALVNHMVSEHLWVPDLLGGARVAAPVPVDTDDPLARLVGRLGRQP